MLDRSPYHHLHVATLLEVKVMVRTTQGELLSMLMLSREGLADELYCSIKSSDVKTKACASCALREFHLYRLCQERLQGHVSLYLMPSFSTLPFLTYSVLNTSRPFSSTRFNTFELSCRPVVLLMCTHCQSILVQDPNIRCIACG